MQQPRFLCPNPVLRVPAAWPSTQPFIIRPIVANQGGELAESILAVLDSPGTVRPGTPGSLPEKRPRWLLP